MPSSEVSDAEQVRRSSHPDNRGSRIALWLAVLLGPLALFGPMLLRGRALFWGAPMLQFTPWRTVALQVLRGGDLPLWNPWLGMGAPLLANYQSALLYPPNALLLLLEVAWGQTLLVMLHLIWAGAGMRYLARRLGLGRLGQGVAAASFALSGYLVGRSGFLSMNATAAWLPWILLAVEGIIHQRPDARWGRSARVLILAAALGLQWLAGHAQLAWYSAVLAGGWCLWRGWQQRGWRGAASASATLLLAAALAFALAAAQLIPTLEYLGQSGRVRGVDADLALTYSFWPWRLLGLLAPHLFGSPAQGNYWGYANYWEDALYIGVLPLLLALLGAFSRAPGRAPMRRFLLLAALASLVLALGMNTPVFPFLFRTVPTFNLFQAPTRWSLIAVFALALLAGQGADGWGAAGPRATYWLRLSTVGACTIAAAAWLGSILLTDLEPSLAPALGQAGLLLALSGGLALLRPRRPSNAWDAAALGLIVVDLLVFGWRLNPSQPLQLQHSDPQAFAPPAGKHRTYMSPELERALKFDKHFRFDSFLPGHDWTQVRAARLPNTGLLDGIPSANNFDPLLTSRYTDFLEALARAAPDRRSQILDLMDVGWEAVEDSQSASGVRYAQRSSAVRARLVPNAVWVDGPQHALRALLDAAHDPMAAVVLEGAPAMDRSRSGAPGVVRQLLASDPHRVELWVEAPEGGWAVLHDAWFPGWQASVDGKPVPVYIADGLFRAVWVPEGSHTIVFSYRAQAFWIGAALSASAWIGSLTWLLRERSAKPDVGR